MAHGFGQGRARRVQHDAGFRHRRRKLGREIDRHARRLTARDHRQPAGPGRGAQQGEDPGALGLAPDRPGQHEAVLLAGGYLVHGQRLAGFAGAQDRQERDTFAPDQPGQPVAGQPADGHQRQAVPAQRLDRAADVQPATARVQHRFRTPQLVAGGHLVNLGRHVERGVQRQGQDRGLGHAAPVSVTAIIEPCARNGTAPDGGRRGQSFSNVCAQSFGGFGPFGQPFSIS